MSSSYCELTEALFHLLWKSLVEAKTTQLITKLQTIEIVNHIVKRWRLSWVHMWLELQSNTFIINTEVSLSPSFAATSVRASVWRSDWRHDGVRKRPTQTGLISWLPGFTATTCNNTAATRTLIISTEGTVTHSGTPQRISAQTVHSLMSTLHTCGWRFIRQLSSSPSLSYCNLFILGSHFNPVNIWNPNDKTLVLVCVKQWGHCQRTLPFLMWYLHDVQLDPMTQKDPVIYYYRSTDHLITLYQQIHTSTAEQHECELDPGSMKLCSRWFDPSQRPAGED